MRCFSAINTLYGASVAHNLLCQGYKASVKRGVRVCHLLYGAAVAQSAFVAHRSRRPLWKGLHLLVEAFAGLVDFNGIYIYFSIRKIEREKALAVGDMILRLSHSFLIE